MRGSSACSVPDIATWDLNGLTPQPSLFSMYSEQLTNLLFFIEATNIRESYVIIASSSDLPRPHFVLVSGAAGTMQL